MKKILRRSALPILGLLLLSSTGCDYLLNSLLPKDPAEVERRIFELVNNERAAAGLEGLIWNDTIAAEARKHSRDMADGTVPFGHDGFSDRFARISQVIPAWAGAENVAYAATAELAVSLWMDSAGHKANVVGEYDYTGVGVAWNGGLGVYYFTQIFIRSR